MLSAWLMVPLLHPSGRPGISPGELCITKALVLFFDTGPRSAHALACWEYGARSLVGRDLQKLAGKRFRETVPGKRRISIFNR